ncbi:hypothetical protein [Vibrio crassostreae]|uniref:hypothetical protein n=1 Tax=Vibrio crassostreae TaxID=246167 RepID=UPI001B30863E|nr:hypothetical protein [Vibrio crassostreae]
MTYTSIDHTVEAINVEIQSLKSSTIPIDNDLTQHINGLSHAKEILSSSSFKQDSFRSILSQSLDTLVSLRDSIDSRIKEINEEEKIEIYRVSSLDVDEYFKTPAEASSRLIEIIEEHKDDEFFDYDLSMTPFKVPPTEIENFVGKIWV